MKKRKPRWSIVSNISRQSFFIAMGVLIGLGWATYAAGTAGRLAFMGVGVKPATAPSPVTTTAPIPAEPTAVPVKPLVALETPSPTAAAPTPTPTPELPTFQIRVSEQQNALPSGGLVGVFASIEIFPQNSYSGLPIVSFSDPDGSQYCSSEAINGSSWYYMWNCTLKDPTEHHSFVVHFSVADGTTTRTGQTLISY